MYGRVKELIVFCEENHEDFKSNLHVVKELRDAFDHLMRIFAVKFGIKDEQEEDYIKINMDKVYGHVYRAGPYRHDSLGLYKTTIKQFLNNLPLPK